MNSIARGIFRPQVVKGMIKKYCEKRDKPKSIKVWKEDRLRVVHSNISIG